VLPREIEGTGGQRGRILNAARPKVGLAQPGG
jgi:hypothetical protein